jgi:uncharacterized protein with HEPN domain
MPRDPRAWLTDTLVACDLLADFTTSKGLDDSLGDALLRSAVERQLEIIGEAVRAAVRHDASLAAQITDAAAIIAFRNQLTHAYSAIDHATVWGILERRVPQLRGDVERLLSQSATGDRWKRVTSLAALDREAIRFIVTSDRVGRTPVPRVVAPAAGPGWRCPRASPPSLAVAVGRTAV